MPTGGVAKPSSQQFALAIQTYMQQNPNSNQGSMGPQGVKGDKGDKGDSGVNGASGTNGTNGAQGIQGPKGDTGLMGPSSKVTLGIITVSQTAVIAITGGMRIITITGITGLLANDDILLFPVSALPAGYAVTNPIATAVGTLQVTVNGPTLAIGASYSMQFRVVALR